MTQFNTTLNGGRMKLYVASKHIPYGNVDVLGIYSSRELAVQRIQEYERGRYFKYEITEVELDQDTEIPI